MKGDDGREIIGYCLYCKEPIYKGQKYAVDENEDKYHKECDRLIEDNTDYFGIGL